MAALNFAMASHTNQLICQVCVLKLIQDLAGRAKGLSHKLPWQW
jgi:hypothetical protein